MGFIFNNLSNFIKLDVFQSAVDCCFYLRGDVGILKVTMLTSQLISWHYLLLCRK